MADIFFSYSKSDKQRIRPFVSALEQRGWSVWWDVRIPAGKTFSQVIEKELKAASCVVAAWSKRSIKSRWVAIEAREGVRRQILVPFFLDKAKLPLEFKDIEAAELYAPESAEFSEEMQGFLDAVKDILSRRKPKMSKSKVDELVYKSQGSIKGGHSSSTEASQTDVFINCSYDPAYRPLFNALVFTVAVSGFRPRSAYEVFDASQSRLDTLSKTIFQCRYGIHDISPADSRSRNNSLGFNIPLELGMFLGAQRFGRGQRDRKFCLILRSDKLRYGEDVSDIAGQDIANHNRDPRTAITIVRNWLANVSGIRLIPSATMIWNRYNEFTCDLPLIYDKLGLTADGLTFVDFSYIVYYWLTKE